MSRFLLVSLTIAAILDEATIRKRRERLDLMTSGLGLDGAYDATLDRIKGQGKGKSALGMAALMWISRTERPMHIGELCDALGVEIGSRDMDSDNIPSEKTLLASCLGLVTVDDSSIVRLVHFTLQEYFNSHSQHFKNPRATMAQVCLTYLNFDSINELSPSLDSAPAETRLLQYASSHWGHYAGGELTEGVKSLVLQLLAKFGRHISAKLLLWGNYNEWERMRRYSEGFTGLHCAAYLGLDAIAIALLEEVEGCSADMVDGWDRTPLVWAAESGHERMVNLLLERKEVNPELRDRYARTTLQHAVMCGHEGVVKLLLDRKEINPESRDRFGRTTLQYAIMCGHEGVIKLLLDRKEVNPDSRDDDGQTPLLCAAKWGHEGAMKLLLDRKEVNLESRDRNGRTVLQHAIIYGYEGIVKLLLDRKEANSDQRDIRGRTLLHYAVKSGHEGNVKLLLDQKEVNPDSRDIYNQTPLWCAAKYGYEEIVKLLLDRKEVNPDSKDNDDQTPLLCAAGGGHEGIVKLLLDRKEVNPDLRDNCGKTPLQCAAEGGHEAIVKLFQGRADTESDTKPNDAPMSPSCILESTYDGLTASSPPSQPHDVTPDTVTQNTCSVLLSAASPPDTADVSSEISSHPPPLDSPLLALQNPVSWTAIAAAATVAIASILAIIIWGDYSIARIPVENPPPPYQPTILAYFPTQ